MKEMGGLAEIEKRNREKGALLYGAIDAQPDFYPRPGREGEPRVMNVVFRLPTEELEKQFVAEAAKQGMVGLTGHRVHGRHPRFALQRGRGRFRRGARRLHAGLRETCRLNTAVFFATKPAMLLAEKRRKAALGVRVAGLPPLYGRRTGFAGRSASPSHSGRMLPRSSCIRERTILPSLAGYGVSSKEHG